MSIDIFMKPVEERGGSFLFLNFLLITAYCYSLTTWYIFPIQFLIKKDGGYSIIFGTL